MRIPAKRMRMRIRRNNGAGSERGWFAAPFILTVIKICAVEWRQG